MTTPDPIPLPFDEGQWIQIRKLNGQQHEEAQRAHRAGFATDNKWAGFFRAVAGSGPSSDDVKRILADPLTGYDRYTLARAGLVAWSYPGAINAVEPPTTEYDAIRDLDDDAVDFIAREVLKLAKPSLFQSREEQEQARKNDIGSSTEA
jgi:hypothetical protein